ncbi:TlpA disulfide reductase family protein [Solitalea koreensis]|nr:TlpA disulfide reductase family protein [Solitalea koreensis]
MKKIIALCAFCIVCICIACTKKGFEITGDVQGVQEGTKVLLLSFGDESEAPDTIAQGKIEKGKFSMQGKVEVPELYVFMIEGIQGYKPIFVENSIIKLSGSADKLMQATVTGSKTHDELNQNQQIINKYQAEQNKIIDEANKKLGDKASSAQKDSVMALLERVRAKQIKEVNEFAIKNPGSFVAPTLILNSADELDPSIYNQIYENFSEDVKKNSAAKYLKVQLDKLATVAVGQKAPELKGKNPEGKDISLSEIKGKLTIIDFWASWCGPCRAENPNVVRIYNKYHDKGLNILGVSLDKNATEWKKAIADDQLNWNHVSDLMFWDSQLAKAYKVEAIPHTVLIDENGVIIANNLRGEELEKKIAAILGKN